MKRLWIFAALFTVACATFGTSIKQTTTLSLQTSETLLAGAQTIERALCFNNPATATNLSGESGPVCTNSIGIAAGLNALRSNPNKTTEQITVHQLIAFYFNQAAGYVKLAALALPAWTSGDPAPTSVAGYQADIVAILAEAQKLIPTPGVANFVSQATQAVNAGAAVATAVGVK